MPCRDGGPCDDVSRSEYERVSRAYTELHGQRDLANAKIDRLEGMLCEALGLAEEAFPDYEQFRTTLKIRDERLLRFLEEHEAQEVDKVRREAASKLSARERRLLGVDRYGNQVKK